SMKSSTVVKLNELQKTLPHQCLTYKEALELTVYNISHNDVASTWMDSWEIPGNDPNVANYVIPQEGCLKDQKRVLIKDSKDAAIERIWRIGGDNGYYAFHWAWYLRGLFDQLIGGIGLNRGRSHPSNIMEGDSIDFWRVIHADKEKGHLTLFAGMKIPGEAWLDLNVESEGDKSYLVQTAVFRPKGFFGKLYWYALVPFHFLIFRKMAKALAGENDNIKKGKAHD
nr:DUF2867 domain-containing protein [Parachlamydiaceae bacterium]